MRRVWLVLAALVLLALVLRSCGTRPDGPSDGPSGEPGATPPAETVSDSGPTASADSGRAAPRESPALECQGLEQRLLASELDREALRQAFGAPGRRSVTTEPNRHIPGATDSLFGLAWPGLEVRLRKPPGKGDLPVRATVGENRYLRYPALGVGAPASRVVEALGEPGERRADALVYDCGVGASQPVTFHLEDGRVERIEISFYVD